MGAVAKVPRPVAVGVAAISAWALVIAAMPGGGRSDGGPAGGAAGGVVKDNLSTFGRSGAFHVYLDPAGSDANDGGAPERPIHSLARAQEVIAAARPKTDVEVRIKQGRYVAPPVKWSTYIPNHTITFLPLDYEFGEGRAGISGLPVFRGDGSNGFWFKAEPAPGHQGDTRLGFYFLQVEGYNAGGLIFDGGTEVSGRRIRGVDQLGVNGNTVYGMVFRGLGSKHVPGGVGYGAIDLVNSRNNVIQDNKFGNLENVGGRAEMALIHGVYLSHQSTGNQISGNHFHRISGDPVRTRNSSNENKIYDNIFERAGSNAYFSDWFADDPRVVGDGDGVECASTGNTFYRNRLISGYRGPVKAWWVRPGEPSHAEPACGSGGATRVHVWGNHP
jgi:Right handed beta helix region